LKHSNAHRKATSNILLGATPPEALEAIAWLWHSRTDRQTDGERIVVLDLVRERKPRFAPHAVVAEFAQVLKAYHISEVFGDKYGGAFHSDEWKRHGITFRAAENTTTEIYLFWLSLLMSGRARLINNSTLKSQTCSLERSVTPAGHEIISHPRVASAHDDVSTSAAGVMVIADKTRPMFHAVLRGWADQRKKTHVRKREKKVTPTYAGDWEIICVATDIGDDPTEIRIPRTDGIFGYWNA
jgi:hypothetical protein